VRGKITKWAVDNLAPKDAAEVVLWDSEIKGFGIRARRGGAKTYILQYRVGAGRNAPLRKLTIGRHGSPWTPQTARVEAKRLLGLVASGQDPAQARSAERRAMTVAELSDLYLAEGATHKKPSTLKADRGRITHHIKPLLGQKLVAKITRADIERMMIDVKTGSRASPPPKDSKRPPGSLPTGGAGVAAQCVALVSTLLTFAIARALRSDNPAKGIKKPPVRKMERFLSEEEIGRLAEALDIESSRTGNPYPTAAINLLLLTGGRRGEILGLQWQHVDFERQCLRLPDSKTGAKIVYLNAPALEVLAGLPRMDSNPHVIPGKCERAPLSGIDKVWFRVRAAARLQGVRLHDLRHSFASMGVAGGLSLPIIGALLGHKHPATTGRYAHLSADPLRAANDLVGRRIAAAMNRTSDVAEHSAKKIVAMPYQPKRAS
jgi:site-specific recombinase XerD